jgi:hypothetical protein
MNGLNLFKVLPILCGFGFAAVVIVRPMVLPEFDSRQVSGYSPGSVSILWI